MVSMSEFNPELKCDKQLLDNYKVKQCDIMQTQGLIIHNIMQRISSIIVLLHIFKQSATEDTSLSLQKFEKNAWIRAWKLGRFGT